MEKKLKWNAIGLVRKTQLLHGELEKEFELIPDNHSKEKKKIQGFVDELKHLLQKMQKISEKLIPDLEKRFRLSFPVPEMIIIALSRPSIRNEFENIQTFFECKETSLLNEDEYRELAATGDAGNVLALIGDAVLDLVVVESLWDSSISTVGKLTVKRKDLVSNQNLAKVCDEWGLFDYRLHKLKQPTKHQSKPGTVDHEKATLVEAIYGVVYLEFGFEKLAQIVPMIEYP